MNTSYIEVRPSLRIERNWFQVILSYYDENHHRKQKWRSLGIKNIPRQ